LKVHDVERTVEFYESVLGLEVTERVGRFAVLTLGAHHHDLARQGGGVGTADPGPAAGPASGLYHAAWELEDGPALRRGSERLIEHDVALSPVGHGISKARDFDARTATAWSATSRTGTGATSGSTRASSDGSVLTARTW
jgi:catechol 2,3-dioxygenase